MKQNEKTRINLKALQMKLTLILLAFTMLGIKSFNAQTTAMDFQGVDCNGNNVHLFEDLDAGKAVILFYYMPSCGSCPPPAQKIQTMANNILANHPGMVKGYSYPYQNSTTCSYSASWVVNNNLSFYTPMDSGAVQVAYYGGFGMPTVVLLGGANHDVLWSTQNFTTSDTTTMKNLILGMLEANTDELTFENLEIYPNPAKDVITVSCSQTEDIAVALITIDGKTVNVPINKKEMNDIVEFTLNIENIQEGNYLIKIWSKDKTETRHVTILH